MSERLEERGLAKADEIEGIWNRADEDGRKLSRRERARRDPGLGAGGAKRAAKGG